METEEIDSNDNKRNEFRKFRPRVPERQGLRSVI